MYFEVVPSKVGYLNILQDCVCDLFILQVKVVRIALLQFGLLWLEAYESSIVELQES